LINSDGDEEHDDVGAVTFWGAMKNHCCGRRTHGYRQRSWCCRRCQWFI
jgi:hypothetical protein